METSKYLNEVAEKMAALGRTQRRCVRRPNMVEYTLITYEENNKTIKSVSKVWVDESKIFPKEEDFYWEPDEDKKKVKAA